jgi:hypothetical protein
MCFLLKQPNFVITRRACRGSTGTPRIKPYEVLVLGLFDSNAVALPGAKCASGHGWRHLTRVAAGTAVEVHPLIASRYRRGAAACLR